MAEDVNQITIDVRTFLKKQDEQPSVKDAMMGKDESTHEELKALDARLNEALTGYQIQLLHHLVDQVARASSQAMDEPARNENPPTGSQVDNARNRRPRKPRQFYGRTALVETVVTTLLANEAAHVPILGPPGIGKTAVLGAIWDDSRLKQKFGDNRFFVCCDIVNSPDSIMNDLANALGLSPSHNLWQSVLDGLESLKCDKLLVVDSLESIWDTPAQLAVEEMLERFCDIPQLCLLVGMRGCIAPTSVDWTRVSLDVLSPLTISDSVELYVKLCGNVQDDLVDLLRLLDGIPLAIHLMAVQGQTRTPTELLDLYKRRRAAFLRRGVGRTVSLKDCIDISLGLRTMMENGHACQLLSTLSLLPTGIPLQRLPEILPSLQEREDGADILHRVSLAIKSPTKILRVLSPIGVYILDERPPGNEFLRDIQKYFIDSCALDLTLGDPAFVEAAERICEELENAIEVLLYTWRLYPAVPAGTSALVHSSLSVATLSDRFGSGDCTELLQTSITAINEEDPVAIAKLRLALGKCFRAKGRSADATRMVGHARNTFDRFKMQEELTECNTVLDNIEFHRMLRQQAP
ncbi:hypothetical protein CALVIDRAFT_344130 [Calocera viscosa TUFC12733]|uniref:NB-ARC domain-containing protein n=1 Tax=Calocera viscosa (strain TUFC12733) TaxID=1330018 RepID=A0A167HD07_CALVF|nr:hypothetical protein CALVIDRAFT_344130 [Calocera viscosa TUFC12733]